MAQRSHFYGKSRIIINPRLILTTPHDPDSKKRYFLNRIGRNSIFKLFQNPKRLFLVLAILLLPISASAGLVSVLNNMFFGSPVEENSLKNKNIQNMSLLVAVANPLSDGQDLNVPTVEKNALVSNVGPSGTSELVAHKPSSDQISIYVVREGDTISQIANMFDVSVNTIKWGNDLHSNTLKVGDTLVILPISGVKYTVVKGDTIASVAKKYKGDVDEIIAYNNLQKGDTLAPGSVIIVPDGEVLAPPSSTSKFTSSSGLKEYAGFYMRPIVGGKKTQGIHGYNGVDLASAIGTPILASADGEVIIARVGGWNGGYGNYIVIRHSNGTQTLYAHTNRNNVSAGDTVKQGDVIGAVGSTGKSTGPHVHFEIRGAKNPF
jgi:LysM repeat protein